MDNIQEFFEELVERMRGEGASSFEAYLSFIDEMLEDKEEWGKIIDDNDLEQIKENLIGRWEEARIKL